MSELTKQKGKRLLKESLEIMHASSLEWLSEITFWKMEISFFKKLMEKYVKKLLLKQDKARFEQLQNRLIYYDGELLDHYGHKIRELEHTLCLLLEKQPDLDQHEYSREDMRYLEKMDEFACEFQSFKADLIALKKELFSLIERLMAQ